MRRYPGQPYATNQNVYDFLLHVSSENDSLPYPSSPGYPSRSSDNIRDESQSPLLPKNVRNGINFNPFVGIMPMSQSNKDPLIKQGLLAPDVDAIPRRKSFGCSRALIALTPNSSSSKTSRRVSWVGEATKEKLYPGGLKSNYKAEKGHLAVRVNPQTEKWFKAVDTDNSGQITADELQKALINGNYTNFSQDACRMMIDMYDQNSSGSIDLNEFQHLFDSINEWKSIFEGYDKDESRTIEHSELCDAFLQMGYGLSSNFVQDLLVKYSPRTKKLTLDNFIVMCVQLKRVSDGFRSRDQSSHGKATLRYEDFVGLAMGLHY